LITVGILIIMSLLLTGCEDDAQVASRNMVHSADNFEINRRVVFFNGITDQYLLEIDGKCSILSSRVDNSELEVICKVGNNEYKKHFFGLSDNTAYFVEQLEPSTASPYYYRVTFKPQAIIPDINTRVTGTLPPEKITIN
jgi:hypothetical protein